MAAGDRYAEVLSDADVAILIPLANSGMGANTHRALPSGLAYLEAWCQAATGRPLPWPADPELVLKFIAHHMWDPDQRAIDPAHGMPDDVAGDLWDRKILKIKGPHAPKTVPGGSLTGRPCTSGRALNRRSTIRALGRLSAWP
jgi:hypothetical protein